MINSSGLLGVITKITFRLYPKPEASATLVVSFNNRYDAINTVPKILRSGTTPLAIEFFERDIVVQVSKKIGVNWPVEKGSAYLMIILTGTTEDDMFAQAEKIAQICEENKSVDVQVADKAQMQADILKLRSEFFSIFKDRTADALDITVPPANIGKLLEKVDEVAKNTIPRSLPTAMPATATCMPISSKRWRNAASSSR